MEFLVLTPESDKAIKRSNKFFKAIRARLIVGKRTYGDKSFYSPLEKTILEIQEELMDVCGWAVVLNSKLEDLKKKCQIISSQQRKT